MNPNSQNQTWSKWTFDVVSGTRNPSFTMMKEMAARFARIVFHSATNMNVKEVTLVDPNGVPVRGWRIEILSEGHPVQEPDFREKMIRTWKEKFFAPGLGPGTTVRSEVKLMAGENPLGQPDDQMIILPPLEFVQEVNARKAKE